MNVLIVEDEWIVSEEIKASVSENGFNVIGQADEGSTALELIQEIKVDLVLMDINIKGEVNGIQLARLIQKNTPCFIIFISSLDNRNQASELKGLNNYDFLPKPFTVESLYRIFEKHGLNLPR